MSKRGRIILISAFLLVILVKQFLVFDLPIWQIPLSTIDDELMVVLAHNLKNGEWLGKYDRFTLVKGMVAPLFIAIISKIGISYISGITLFYTLACLYFVFSIRKVITNKWYLFVMFTILVFNPDIASKEVLQRIYRNGLIPSFVLIIIGSYIQMFLMRKGKYRYPIIFAIITGIAFSGFYYTREDSIWMMPFMLFILLVSAIYFLIENKKINKDFVIRTAISLIPFVIFMITTAIISLMNYKYYGVYFTNELNDSNFARAMKDIYSVKCDENIECVSVTKEKIKKIATFSASMQQIEEDMYDIMDLYGKWDRNPDDGNVEDGWFFWVLRDAVSNAGYYEDAQTADLFYLQLSYDIENALDQGWLEKQSGVMPSALMAPWKKGNASKLVKAYFSTLKFIAGFEGIEIKNNLSSYEYEKTDIYQEMSNNKIIFNEDLVDGENEYTLSIKYKTDILNTITKIYKIIGYILGILGILTYIIITVLMIKDSISKKYDLMTQWIILSSIIGTFFCITLGVAYNHVVSCYSINALYLAGSYPLFISFSIMAVYFLIEWKLKEKNCEKQN